jgi:RNA polymerase sigma factor (sigma-70 family)
MEPWRAELSAGRHGDAWDRFIEEYRRLIVATIRRVVHDRDDVLDVFALVCDALHANELARLRQYVDRSAHNARFSTWLVVVVRNLTIDWLRERDGRRRDITPANLSQLQREIFNAVFLERRSHREAYELIASRTRSPIGFGRFLREVRETYRLVRTRRPGRHDRATAPVLQPEEWSGELGDPRDAVERADAARHIDDALASLTPDVRLAVQLFIVERVGADDIARVLNWPNAKAVYNRVYRALDAVRARLERAGVRREDL